MCASSFRIKGGFHVFELHRLAVKTELNGSSYLLVNRLDDSLVLFLGPAEVSLQQSVEDQVAAAVDFGMKGTPMKVEDMEKNLFAE